MKEACVICSAAPADRPWFVEVNGRQVCSECCREATVKAHERWLERNKKVVTSFLRK